MPAPDGPPDLFGIGKLIGIAAGLLFTLRIATATRNWWARRKRNRELEAMRARRRDSKAPPADASSS